MSFVENREGVRPASVAAVVAVHVVIGYAVISGLAMQVVRFVDAPIVANNYPADMTPPPPLRAPPPRSHDVTPTPVHPEDSIVDLPLRTQTLEISQIPVETMPHQAVTTIDNPPARTSLAKGAAIIGNRAAWVTSEDYPSSSLRAEAQGITAILATIGIDGRVSACRVTMSSGDRALDEAACRTYGRRARFAPALDEAGKPIVSERADRIRWQLPAQ